MSTKTTLKRIALVAVSALGLGLFATVAPAQAAGDATFSVNTTSQTIVVSGTAGDASAGDTTTASRAMAVFRICVSDADGARALEADETITASVVGVPTSVSTKTLNANSTDIGFVELNYSQANAGGGVGGTVAGLPVAYVPDTTTGGASVSYKAVSSADQSTQVTIAAGRADAARYLDGTIGIANTEVSDSGTARIYGTNNCYLLGAHGFGNQSWDQGAYTLRLSLNDSGFVTKTQELTVKYVRSAADSGAAITITRTGVINDDALYSYTTLNNTAVTLTNGTAGGRVFEYGSNAGIPLCPTLQVAVVDQDGVVETTTGLFIGDTGTAGQDHVASTSDSATVVSNTLQNAFCNGTYGLFTNATTVWDTTMTNNATSGNTTSFRVRYGSTTATLAFTVNTTPTADVSTSTIGITATASKNHSNTANTLLMNNGNRWTLPLTTKTAKLTVRALNSSSVAVQDYPLVFRVTWSGAVSQGEVTPRNTVAATDLYATTVRTDSNGYASLDLTNNSPVDGAQATVTVSGFTTGQTAAGQVILWQKSKPTTVVSDPSGDYKAATKSTQKITWTFTDTFGAPVAGEVVDFTISGANSATSTVVIPSTTTDANGQASYTFTDSAGVEASTTLGTTTVRAVARSESLGLSRVITWVATVPVVATLTGAYNDEEDAGTYSDVIPTTPMYDTATTGTKYLIRTAANTTRDMNLSWPQTEVVGFRYTVKDAAGALISGVPVTITTTDGLWVLGSTGLPVTSRTMYPTTGGTVTFNVVGTKIGTHTLTVTAGTVSSTAQLVFGNSLGDARYVTMSASTASGTANADKLPSVTAKVTDRFGNPVSGVTLSVVHTGVGRLAGGAKTSTFTTDASGEYVIEASSTEAGTATVKVTASTGNTTNQLADLAGYVGSTALIDAITAGVEDASATFTFAAGTSAATAAAEAASDAAAEAIDAANAATDAANLAAEAADAATVAAEEARDAADAATAAVEELATQVATLMAALKAQITTLANTVAKIAKKVKA